MKLSQTMQWLSSGCCVILAALQVGCQTRVGPAFDARQAEPSGPSALTNLSAVALVQQIQPEWLRTPTDFFVLGPGDRLEIEVLGDATTKASTVVGPDGKIYYYLLPGLNVWGLTLGETKTLLEKELIKYFREPPKVTLTLRAVESRQVWMLGRVSKPGIYPLAMPMTLLEAITLAGGPATVTPVLLQAGGPAAAGPAGTAVEVADLRRSFLLRQGQLLPVNFDRLLREGDLSQNIYLRADDFIYLPSAISREVYVLGAVNQPHAVGVGEQPTLVSAIASAGGTIKDAYLSHVAIVRGSLNEPKIAIIDYKAIVRGEAPDVMLEPRDIVYVPFSPYRTLTRYADLILTTFVRTVGVNEGARAVSGGTIPVGVNVPVGP